MATLPTSGAVSLGDIQSVFGGVAPTGINEYYNGGAYIPAGINANTKIPASGSVNINEFHGASNRQTINYVFSAHTANAVVNVTSLAGYIAGITDVFITVNQGIYVYSNALGTAALSITGTLTAGDTVNLINRGYIIGQGGNGADMSASGAIAAQSGTLALNMGCALFIDSTGGYIAGGGGGGAHGTNVGYVYSGGRISYYYRYSGGGGGAGGGAGGYGANYTTLYGGGGGGGIGGVGAQGAAVNYPGYGGGSGGGGAYISGGGGGGRILPGGGGGSTYGGVSGTANNVGGNGSTTYGSSGGGGGWGASGGLGYQLSSGGSGWLGDYGLGGNAVTTNGNALTWIGGMPTTIYGAVV